MKKTLIAFAALSAVAGLAQAQSTVTLYGVADAFVGSVKTETKVGAATTSLTQTKVDSGGVNGSRWGLRGAEDLGSGLKAVFQLESGINIDAGSSAQGGVLFGRQAFVGLSGGFGTVSLGRQYTAYDVLRGATNNTYDAATFATTATVWGNGIADYANRVNNSIAYASPDFGGFSGAAVFSLGEDKTATNSATSNNSLHLKYANGPLLVGYAYQGEKFVTSPTTTSTRKYNYFAGSYDLGVAKLTGGYNTAKVTGVEDKEYQLGVSVPFGSASIAAGYTNSKSEAGAVTNKGTGFSLLGTYDLSKRTRLYAATTNTKTETAGGNNSVKIVTFATGIRHSF